MRSFLSVAVFPVSETGRTFLQWYSNFSADGPVEEKLTRAFVNLYTAFVADLRAHLDLDPAA